MYDTITTPRASGYQPPFTPISSSYVNSYIPKAHLASFCRSRGIKRLAVFGSALRSDFGPDSDIDLLVEFEQGRTPGLLGIAGMELDLSDMLGRRVDLRTAGDVSRRFRQQVLNEAQVQYERV